MPLTCLPLRIPHKAEEVVYQSLLDGPQHLARQEPRGAEDLFPRPEVERWSEPVKTVQKKETSRRGGASFDRLGDLEKVVNRGLSVDIII